ncbi:MAG: FCD domain-containing protein [Pseudomonadota bacterium]
MSAQTENTREASRRLAAAIRAHVTAKIEAREWAAGEKIPTEGDFVRNFGAARNTVRKALGALETEGVIVRHVGRGTFVAEPSAPAAAGLCSPADIMEARITLEPAIARLSVVRATGRDIAKAQACLKKFAAAKTLAEYERLDATLHWTIVAASRNEFYKKIFSDINEIRNGAEWTALKKASTTKATKAAYYEDHRLIVEAFARRDAQGLERALRDHLIRVKRNLLQTPA